MWKPIGSAPKDGTKIMVSRSCWFLKDSAAPEVGRHDEIVANVFWQDRSGWVSPSSVGRHENGSLTLLSHGWVVMFWQPMPDFPQFDPVD